MKTSNLLRRETLRRVLSMFLGLCILFTIGCTKDPIDPPEQLPVDTSYTLKLYDANVPILMDTVYKKIGDMFDFSWDYKGGKSFEILKDGNHFSFASSGKESILVAKQIVFNFKVDGKKVRSQVIILIQEVNLPVITLSASPSRGAPGTVFNITVVISDANSASSDLPSFSGVSGTFSTPALTATTTYSFYATNEDGTTTKTITITVDPPVGPDSTDLLVLDRWYEGIVKYKNYESDPWDSLVPSTIYEWTIYYRDGTKKTFEPPSTVVSYGIWWWSENKEYLMGAYTNTVIRLDSTTLILKRNEACSSCPLGYKIVMREWTHQQYVTNRSTSVNKNTVDGKWVK